MAQLLFRRDTILAPEFRTLMGCPPMREEGGEKEEAEGGAGKEDDEIVPEEEGGDGGQEEEEDTGSVFDKNGSVVAEEDRESEWEVEEMA
uniref:Uncharacterized protein n=1 Tax=Globodera pallida TaxID=36090 RepID=A0A183CQK2_GLOPA